ncbi:hypothetical protein FGO68_gene2352 [Halteria grandinella]|uniref:Uncharacterized protein n=1 Tax=Halteria grandinella TaxID=5974 RepID=A0A8J8NKJ4_HALGN|nr:hypothetical protein FGO68_gene2352 [Halteria grandinella]
MTSFCQNHSRNENWWSRRITSSDDFWLLRSTSVAAEQFLQLQFNSRYVCCMLNWLLIMPNSTPTWLKPQPCSWLMVALKRFSQGILGMVQFCWSKCSLREDRLRAERGEDEGFHIRQMKKELIILQISSPISLLA